ncbi:MAG: 3'(2'),5'-bisphosphate nucleotidase CysQ [Deltaproteobacteria bacterium]|nr:3'(2'),5'-bisphosphate nucleotidase CysQ [Deltaproteobacteria bacterium]
MPHESPAPPTLEAVVAVAQGACELTRCLVRSPLQRRQKDDDSPVTVVDEAVDAYLHAHLRPLFASAAWLSEETKDRPERLGAHWLWIVDPIDGTRSLLAGEPEYCVSIALVECAFGPRLAVVANPSTGDVFRAEAGGGAFDQRDHPMRVRPRWNPTEATFLASRTDAAQGLWRERWASGTVRPMGGLAWKMAMVAAGKADGHATLGPRSEWDAAAGALLVAEAGGRCCDLAGRPLRYNQAVPHYRGCVVASAAAFDAMLAAAQAEARARGDGADG